MPVNAFMTRSWAAVQPSSLPKRQAGLPSASISMRSTSMLRLNDGKTLRASTLFWMAMDVHFRTSHRNVQQRKATERHENGPTTKADEVETGSRNVSVRPCTPERTNAEGRDSRRT